MLWLIPIGLLAAWCEVNWPWRPADFDRRLGLECGAGGRMQVARAVIAAEAES